jgi:hypothetical protein
MRIRDPRWKNLDPGSGMEKIRIRDKHPGSTTLLPHIEKKGKERVQCNALLADRGCVPLKSLSFINKKIIFVNFKKIIKDPT